ncbi:MAG: alpha-amylase family glycosyl hydrolase [Syntrophotaleaceae bacterium]
MASYDQDRDRYFPLSVQLSARARAERALPLEPQDIAGAGALYHLRQMSARLPEGARSAGKLNLLARLNAAMRILAGRYLEARRCDFSTEGVIVDGRTLRLAAQAPTLEALVSLFPPAAVLRGQTFEEYLKGSKGGDGRRRAVVELFLLGLQNANPAAAPFRCLFADDDLTRRIPYRKLLGELDQIFSGVSALRGLGGSLRDLLEAPVKAAPDSLSGQLAYIRENWAEFLPEELLNEIAAAFDVLSSEEMQRGWGPVQTMVPSFGYDTDYERFSPDTDWMPQVVLIAKSVYVWLDQLSRQYGRPIGRLDEIPDAELDRLARRGFNALWLIGLWERSPASRQIKRMMGNPEAEASAYSLYDYVVADDLGGEEAVAGLNHRCRQRGIRLACDVVPNHTGIYSRWTREHPDWFVQLDYAPYPNYRFTGPDLSLSDDCGIQIEDGYWDHSDAGVVFRYWEKSTGRVRYIYHGNDGTHMPWNDTAQLNFLLAEVREAVIRTILHVARTFKVIRFDAAMTLAKKHYQRLWFPLPGGGAGVPSRAEHWMDREEFERVFPVEFWREVVDRVAAEVPDTLLLAEAFWLMEEFFVRTLGMHRVYNSAFMNMLKMEENAKYQQVLRGTLEFNPEILKRFVNFMNNPDEATAVEQFGKHDKYFGVAVLLATLPGLPMFGHGQIEGFAEKYGMEYRRAYWEETIDEGFVQYHESQIFPLLRKRYLFSEAADFELFFFEQDGQVNENVFAYSNRRGGERALVVYHNRFGEAAGWVRRTATKAHRNAEGIMVPHQTVLGEALQLSSEEGVLYRFRDQRTGQEYLRSGRGLCEQGLFFQLGAYEYHVFLDFQELRDQDGSWSELCGRLEGRPVADLDRERKLLQLAPLLDLWRRVLDPELLGPLTGELTGRVEPETTVCQLAIKEMAERLGAFLLKLGEAAEAPEPTATLVERVVLELETLGDLFQGVKETPKDESDADPAAEEDLEFWVRRFRAPVGGKDTPPFALALLVYLLLHRIGELAADLGSAARSADWLDDYLLSEPLAKLLPKETMDLITVMIRHQDFLAPAAAFRPLPELLESGAVCSYLGVHHHAGAEWFSRERLESLLFGLSAAALPDAAVRLHDKKERLDAHLEQVRKEISAWLSAAEEAGYRVDKWRELL